MASKDALLNIQGKPTKIGDLSNNVKCRMILELMETRDRLKVNLHNTSVVNIITKKQSKYFRELAYLKNHQINELKRTMYNVWKHEP